MANIELPENKNIEKERNPEIAVERAANEVLSTGEIQEAVNPGAFSETVQNAKKYLKSGVKGAAIGGGIPILGGLFLAGKMLLGLARFAKKAIEKKGNITFKEGYEIGEKIFDFDKKKDK